MRRGNETGQDLCVQGAERAPVSSGLRSSLDRVLKISLGVLVASALIVPGHMPLAVLVMHAAFLCVVGASYALLRAHRDRASVAVLSGASWAVSTAAMFAFGGVRSPVLFVYLPIVVIAGMFWSERALLGLAAASVASVVLALYLGMLGALPRPLAPLTEPRMVVIFCGSLAMTAALLTMAFHHMSSMRRELMRSSTLSEDLEHRLETAERFDSIGRVAGGVAHDFNNLLAIISTSAALLEKQLAKDSAGYQFAREIADAGARASNLSRRLLAFGRVRNRPGPAPRVRLDDVLSEMTTILSRLAGPRCQVAVHAGARFSTVRVDRAEIEQILCNLAQNAGEAMPGGGPVTFTTEDVGPARNAPDAAAYVRLVVEDRGIGMDEETRSRIFEPFFTTKESGTGLGLSTVRDIVRRHGGKIRVESAPGSGSRFEVLLPCDRATGNARPEPTEARATTTGAGLGESPKVAPPRAERV